MGGEVIAGGRTVCVAGASYTTSIRKQKEPARDPLPPIRPRLVKVPQPLQLCPQLGTQELMGYFHA